MWILKKVLVYFLPGRWSLKASFLSFLNVGGPQVSVIDTLLSIHSFSLFISSLTAFVFYLETDESQIYAS